MLLSFRGFVFLRIKMTFIKYKLRNDHLAIYQTEKDVYASIKTLSNNNMIFQLKRCCMQNTINKTIYIEYGSTHAVKKFS
jgi:hypothetical protein